MGRLCWFENGGCDHIIFIGVESRHTAGMNKPWRTFCRPGTKFCEYYECRGSSMIGAANISSVTKLVAGTGAVSRYKLYRNQRFITVQDLNCVQMCVSGCNAYYKFVLSAGTKAKSVTNNLPILSVLCLGIVYLKSRHYSRFSLTYSSV